MCRGGGGGGGQGAGRWGAGEGNVIMRIGTQQQH